MKRFDDYLIVTDLDGTLFKNQNNIPKVNVIAIDKFVSLGGKFTVATGRGIEATRFITKEINISSPLIVCNGHAVYDYHDEKMIYCEYLPEEVKSFTFDILNRFENVGIEIHLDNEVHILRKNDIVCQHMAYEKLEYIDDDFNSAKNLNWLKMIAVDEPEKLNIVREYAKNMKMETFKTVDTAGFFMEVMKNGVNKGTATLKLAKYLNIPESHVFTIGNYYNDIELVESGAVGAYVNDSPEDLKNNADYITKLNCDDGAIAEFIDYVMSI